MKFYIKEQEILIDKEDWHKIKSFTWCLNKMGNAHCIKYRVFRTPKDGFVYLHRFILNAKKGQIVDHINGNTLDNRKENLRFVDFKGNARNKQKSHGKSIYKGVVFDAREQPLRKRWVAQIKVNYKCIKIGRYFTEEEAAKAYDRKALELHGEYARLNGISI